MSYRLLKAKAFPIIALSILFIIPFGLHLASADTVGDNDFNSQSYSKVVDWYNYVRAYAAAHNLPAPPTNEHAYIYTNYINIGGFQIFYAGLVNATNNGMNVTIPLQTFFEHYRTIGGKDAITASSFLGLVSFRENTTDIYPNSPDKNDTVYASFSLGYLLQAMGTHPYTYISTSTPIPLAHPDANHWTWGLKYTNLNAVWWRINPDPNALIPWDRNTPRGFAQYNELTFNYALNIDSTTRTANLTTTYTIGRMTDLYILAPTPVNHLNSTGTYYLNGSRINTQTIYQYLQARQFKLSLVLSNKAILASPVIDKADSGASVDNDNETDVSHTAVTTAAASDGDRIFRADFGVKSQYKLYNYTADSSENTASNYNVNVRTVNVRGWGGNPVFALQNSFMGFLPIFVANVDPGLIQQAKAGDVQFSTANYLYIITYPTWGGYKIVHDPDYTAFYTPSNEGLLTAIFLAVAVAAGVGGLFAFLFRKRRTAGISVGAAGPTGPSPTQGPSPPSPSIPGR